MTQPAVYKPVPGGSWEDCEILGCVDGNYVVREVGKIWPGVAITPHVRIPAGTFEAREYTNERAEACGAGMKRWWSTRRLPPDIDRWKWRLLREALGREAALAELPVVSP